MHEFLHFFGICADHDAHLNLLSLISDNAIVNQISHTFNSIRLYFRIKV